MSHLRAFSDVVVASGSPIRRSETARLSIPSVPQEEARARLATLTSRQEEILSFILQGHPNKNIAADLEISRRTVEVHRAAIMKKAGARSISALVQISLAAF